MNSSLRDYCPNAYSDRWLISPSSSKSLAITYICLVPLTVISNSIVLYRIISAKLYKKVSNFFILIMTIADFLIGTITLPSVYALYSKYASVRVCTLELATQFISTSLVYVSITMVMLVAIDRLVHQKFPMRFCMIFSNRFAKLIAFISIFVSMLVSGLLTMSSVFNRIRIVSLICSVLFVVIIVVVFISYFRTYVHIIKYVRSSTVWNPRRTVDSRTIVPQPSKQRNPRYLRQFSTTIFLIILGICFCYLPFVIVMSLALFKSYSNKCIMDCSGDSEGLRLSLYVSYALIYSNSSLNSLVIIFRNRSVARYVQKRKIAAVSLEKVRFRRPSAISMM